MGLPPHHINRNIFHLTWQLSAAEVSTVAPQQKGLWYEAPGWGWGLSVETVSLRFLSPASFRDPKKILLLNSATSQTTPQAAHILISWPNEAGHLSAKLNRGETASKLLFFFSLFSHQQRRKSYFVLASVCGPVLLLMYIPGYLSSVAYVCVRVLCVW